MLILYQEFELNELNAKEKHFKFQHYFYYKFSLLIGKFREDFLMKAFSYILFINPFHINNL